MKDETTAKAVTAAKLENAAKAAPEAEVAPTARTTAEAASRDETTAAAEITAVETAAPGEQTAPAKKAAVAKKATAAKKAAPAKATPAQQTTAVKATAVKATATRKATTGGQASAATKATAAKSAPTTTPTKATGARKTASKKANVATESVGHDEPEPIQLELPVADSLTATRPAPRTKPEQTEARRPEARQTETGQAEPKQTEPKQTKPKQTEPKRTAPIQRQPIPAEVDAEDQPEAAYVEAEQTGPARVEAEQAGPARVEAEQTGPARVEVLTGPAGTAGDATGVEPPAMAIEGVPIRVRATATVRMVRRTREELPTDVDLARAVKGRPALASAALALIAIRRWGESAREQARQLWRDYPRVAPERLAAAALKTAKRRSRYAVGAAIVGGPIGVAAGVGAVTIAKARLIIDVAAIFDYDPLDPARAADILVLLGAYPDGPAARKAIGELAGDVDGGSDGDAPSAKTTWTSSTAQLLTRTAGRILPGVGTIAQALKGDAETERLGQRAIRYYRD